MRPCRVHAYRRASCPECNEMTALFVPSKNLGLVALKKAWPDRDDKDRADYITEAVGTDGSVRVRPLTFDDILEWVRRKVRGEVE